MLMYMSMDELEWRWFQTQHQWSLGGKGGGLLGH